MHTHQTVAVIDVGSNSIKLLVAKPSLGKGHIQSIFAETIETRISTGISQALPSLNEQAMQAGSATISKLVRLAQSFHPRVIQIVATSAVRDASNASQFIDRVNDLTKLEMRILSGTEEAVTIGRGLRCDPQIVDVERFIQMDIGGGSLELIRFHHGQIQQALSLPLGAVRLSEHFIPDRDAAIPPASAARIQDHVIATLQASAFSFEPIEDPLIATGGAFTVTRAMLAAQVNQTIHSYTPVLSKQAISQLKSELIPLTLHKRIAVPQLPATRADILPAALMTIEALLDYAQRDSVTHSFYNLAYGIAAELLGTVPESS